MLERNYQPKLIKKLRDMFPGCVILKNDANYIQGFPDLTVLYKDKWAVLETKKGASAKKQPNQDHYVEQLDNMSFSRFVHPGNEEEVLRELRKTFEP